MDVYDLRYTQVDPEPSVAEQLLHLQQQVAELEDMLATAELRDSYCYQKYVLLETAAHQLFALYGWGNEATWDAFAGLRKVADDVQSLRRQVHYWRQRAREDVK